MALHFCRASPLLPWPISAESHVISALINNRAEIAGAIARSVEGCHRIVRSGLSNDAKVAMPSSEGLKVMPKLIVLTPRPGMLGRLSGAAVAALAMVSPLQAFQNLTAAPAGKQAQQDQSHSAQPSQALPQSAPSEPAANPEPQAVAPSPLVPAANSPAVVPSRNGEASRENEGTPATVVDEQQLESILGKNVLGPSGENMGRIVDIIADHTGEVRAAIIDFGGFLGVGTRKIAIDWHTIRFPSDGKKGDVVVNLTRDQLRLAPIFTPGDPVVILGRPEAAP
jgi:hypothetical protein